MTLPNWLRTALAALAAALLPACDAINLPEIQPGATTQIEVRSRMGEPSFVHWNDDGTATWEYNRQPNGIHCYMISFGSDLVVAKVEQVLTEANFARIRPGLSKDEVRRLLGAPATKAVFDNLGEEIWEWRVAGMMPTELTYFMVHFDLGHGGVKRTSQRVEPRG